MRIVAGSARGRPIQGPKTQGIRPTADRVRESVFNILGQFLSGEAVLDLYAGTGALSLEALSRGAGHAVLVDADRAAAELCRKNAAALGFCDQVEVILAPADRALEQLARGGRRFALVFADPPYAARALEGLLGKLEPPGVLEEKGTFIVEHDKREAAPEVAGALHRVDQRAFGDTRVSLYRRVIP